MSDDGYLTREQVRAIDALAISTYHMPGVLLMENAGRNAAEVLKRQLSNREPVLIVCGEGNNGGDGFVIARHLQIAEIPVRIILFAPLSRRGVPRLSEDSTINFGIAKAAEIPIQIVDTAEPGDWLAEFQVECSRAEWIVDCLFGTGLTRPVVGVQAEVVQAINASGTKIFAIDLPSGLDANTGLPMGATVKATRTVTFVARKIGFRDENSKLFTGEIDVVDIGAPKKILDEAKRE